MFKKFWVFLYKTNSSFLVKRGMKFRNWRPIRAYKRRLNNYVISHYKSNYAEINGRKMHLDPHDSLRLSIKEYSPFHQKLMDNEIEEGDVVLDLGANIGFWTLFFAQKVGKQGKVFAFEPEPSNVELLKKNVLINNYDNVIIEQKAVSNKTEKLKLFLSYETTDHRIYDPSGDRDFVEIDSIRLDDYFTNFPTEINFIKSNIQGADFSAIQGLSEVIKKSKKIKMAIEYYPELLKGFNSDPGEFITYLENLGFKIFNIDYINHQIYPITKEEIIKKYVTGKFSGTWLFCKK